MKLPIYCEYSWWKYVSSENYQPNSSLIDIFYVDLSFQAAQSILSSPKDEALQVMQDLSQNFPTKAK